MTSWDVVVVGAGNAALCAALSARENGARVLVLERAPRTERGGNTAFTAGAMRFVYEGIDDVLELVPDLSEQDRAMTDFGSYTDAQFFDDIARVTEYRADPDLADMLVYRSFDDAALDADQGRPVPAQLRPAGLQGRRQVHLLGRPPDRGLGGGLGPGRRAHHRPGRRSGIHIQYGARACSLHRRRRSGSTACGSAAAREPSRYGRAPSCWPRRLPGQRRDGAPSTSGPGWDLAKVRGTRYNTGDGIQMALDSGRHPVGPLVRLPRGRLGPERAGVRRPRGRRRVQEAQLPVRDHGQRQRRAVPRRGRRLPQLHLRQVRPRHSGQPGQFAWQVFDAKVAPPAPGRVPDPRRSPR